MECHTLVQLAVSKFPILFSINFGPEGSFGSLRRVRRTELQAQTQQLRCTSQMICMVSM